MAQNTHVAADDNAPPVTRTLADFVSKFASGAFSPEVEHEARRTLLNWLGCAIGASRHATLEAALAAVRELEPPMQSTVLGRRDRWTWRAPHC